VRPRALGMSKISHSVSQKIKQINSEVDKVWSKYDLTGDGTLSMEEALELLNSVELGDFVEGATAVRPLHVRGEAGGGGCAKCYRCNRNNV
jgi:hypothetical protein